MNSPNDLRQLSPVPHMETFHVSDTYFEVSKFQRHANLRSKYNTLIVSSLNVSQFVGEKIFFLLNVAYTMATLDII
jgi:hypothetical protein